MFQTYRTFKRSFRYLAQEHYMSRVIRKPDFCLCENKDAVTAQISCAVTAHLISAFIFTAVTAQLISAFVFDTQIVQFLIYLYQTFQDSNFLLELYRPVCVKPGRKPHRPNFSCCSSYMAEAALISLDH